MKLKDFKNKPEQYNAIVKTLKMKGIEYTDESDVGDLIGQVDESNKAANIAAGGNSKRGRR